MRGGWVSDITVVNVRMGEAEMAANANARKRVGVSENGGVGSAGAKVMGERAVKKGWVCGAVKGRLRVEDPLSRSSGTLFERVVSRCRRSEP